MLAAAAAAGLPGPMMMAGVSRAGPHWLGLAGLQEFFRLGFEALAAARAAEQIVLSLVGEAVLGGLALDAHAADRIDRRACCLASAAAGRRLGAMVMAGISRALVMFVICLRHRSSPSHLNNIPYGGI
jgi:hypothetical protein